MLFYNTYVSYYQNDIDTYIDFNEKYVLKHFIFKNKNRYFYEFSIAPFISPEVLILTKIFFSLQAVVFEL